MPIKIIKQTFINPFAMVIVANNFLGFFRCFIISRLRRSLLLLISFIWVVRKVKKAVSAPDIRAESIINSTASKMFIPVFKSIDCKIILVLIINTIRNGSVVSKVLFLFFYYLKWQIISFLRGRFNIGFRLFFFRTGIIGITLFCT